MEAGLRDDPVRNTSECVSNALFQLGMEPRSEARDLFMTDIKFVRVRQCAEERAGCGAPPERPYYNMLGLKQDASNDDIRRQFQQRMLQLEMAYEWLVNDDRRQVYDLYIEWTNWPDWYRGDRFSRRHNEVQFFRTEKRIKHVLSQSQASAILNLNSHARYY